MDSKKSLTTNIKDFLSSQLGLLILGAVISSLIVPWFFQVWQDYQKELEIKTDLVGKISEDVTRIIMSTQFVLLTNNRDQIKTVEQHRELLNELNEEYKQWEINSAVIGSQLQAYFPHTDLANEWGSLNVYSGSFSENVTDFYRLTALVAPNSTRDIDFFDDRQNLLQQKDDLIQRILSSEMTSFSAKPFQIFRTS
jgi:hypothetical protein